MGKTKHKSKISKRSRAGKELVYGKRYSINNERDDDK